jgi:hypothetical protein
MFGAFEGGYDLAIGDLKQKHFHQSSAAMMNTTFCRNFSSGASLTTISKLVGSAKTNVTAPLCFSLKTFSPHFTSPFLQATRSYSSTINQSTSSWSLFSNNTQSTPQQTRSYSATPKMSNTKCYFDCEWTGPTVEVDETGQITSKGPSKGKLSPHCVNYSS